MDGSAGQELSPTFGSELGLSPNDWVARGMLTGHRVVNFFVVPNNSSLLPVREVVTRYEDTVLISASVPVRPLRYNPDTTSQAYVVREFVAEEERQHALETGEPLRTPLPYELRKARPQESDEAGI